MMKKLFILWLLFPLTGCKDKIIIQPEKLPTAYLNEPYTAAIDIKGGKVINYSFSMNFSDNNFKLHNNKNDDDFNHLIISGTPTSLKPIKVDFGGSTYGTMLTGQDFEKIYTIEVKQR